MQVFDINDILKAAVQIEANGEQFYRYAVGLTEDQETKKLFEYLADEEVNHHKIFQEMLAKLVDYKPRESYPGEYLDYIRSYTEKILFTKAESAQELPQKVKNVRDAIDYAIQRELDSILYYHEMKSFVPEQQHQAIEEIITEERKHYYNLTKIQDKHIAK